jgi:signal transduction histidine kinase
MGPVEEVMKLYREMASQKSITLEWEMEGNTSVYADRELFHIICRNLLTNAIKFTGKGGKIRISSLHQDGDGKLIYSISDTGVGIPEERLASILSGPDLVSTAGTDKEKGTGLGLRLCHELALINKGELRIDSKENEGTTIYVSIPVRAPGA